MVMRGPVVCNDFDFDACTSRKNYRPVLNSILNISVSKEDGGAVRVLRRRYCRMPAASR
ncbi:hypothetical protein BOTBODRAFT_491455 [Botryobasidium botryosum FD-172 SS1]|uniref:Uncharacterized protein n=1 Tax=Botryobasidium botryosum (strain FD-172 SS1) TaxID=930990 RepID=A0A067MGB0_BOTB1|nr:hypothetical protein BOTBODRAFT_491455 [Botryobasidium botryosum FD-172 SS1]